MLLETVSSNIESKEQRQPVRRNMKVSKVVLVISAKVPRGQWSLEVSLNWLKEMIRLFKS